MESENLTVTSTLTPQQKMCLQMVQGTDLGISEIACRCGLGRSTVYKTVRKNPGEDFLKRRAEEASAEKAHKGAMSLIGESSDPVTVIDLPAEVPAAEQPAATDGGRADRGRPPLTPKQKRIYDIIEELSAKGNMDVRFPYAEVIRKYREDTGEYVCGDTVYRVRKKWIAAKGGTPYAAPRRALPSKPAAAAKGDDTVEVRLGSGAAGLTLGGSSGSVAGVLLAMLRQGGLS